MCRTAPINGCVSVGATIRPIPTSGISATAWQVEKQRIKDELRSGNYRFSLLSRITLKTSDETDLCALAHRERAVIWNGRRPPGRASAMLQAVLRSRAYDEPDARSLCEMRFRRSTGPFPAATRRHL